MTSTVQETVERPLPSTSFVTQKKIIEILTEKGAMTRDELCEAFGFTKYQYEHTDYIFIEEMQDLVPHTEIQVLYHGRTTIYDNLKKLMKKGRVEKFTYDNGKRGRPLTYWKLKEQFHFFYFYIKLHYKAKKCEN